MILLPIQYNLLLVVTSVLVAILASYVALDLANSVTRARGRVQAVWLAFGAITMGLGIWSMHFVGMLAVQMPGVPMSYDVPLMALSIVIAVGASALALFVMSRPVVLLSSLVAAGIAMAVAIAGMHYTGMYSMRMPARIEWDLRLVVVSVLIALSASFGALFVARRLRQDQEPRLQRVAAILMGVAIAGMHYTGMAAATFYATGTPVPAGDHVLPSSGLGLTVAGATALILFLALTVSVIDRAFFQGRKKVEDMTAERELRERFVSALAHDLRNPLTAAKMSASLAVRGAEDPDVVRKFGNKVIHNIERMDQMVQDLLDAHRITVGQALPLQLEPVELGRLLRETLDDLTTTHGDRFQLHCPTPIEGMWDPKYLRRAVENLCTNAVKYGSDGTPVRVRVEDLAAAEVCIRVHNEGKPIPPEELPQLFQMFHRGGDAERAGKRGWGLGLSIVRGTAEAHGGTVSATSASGIGTEFTLRIPRMAGARPGLTKRVHASLSGAGVSEA